MARDFLLEIGVEEMPARFLNPALQQLQDLAASLLDEHRLQFEGVRALGTPRRLALYVKGLAEVQEPLVEEVKGPAAKVAYKDGEPTRAAQGFAKNQGVAVEDLIIKPVGPVEYVFAVKREEGRAAAELLMELAPQIVAGLHFPKPMRWGNLDFRFARPIRWLVALYGEDVIPFKLAGLTAGRVTYGHRFLSRGPMEINTPQEYVASLEGAYVIVDPLEREKRIRQQIEEMAREAGGKVPPDEELLDEVNNLVEYPNALLGSFNPRYLELPPEVLVTLMREHQRYFPVEGKDGKLLPRFITISNVGSESLDVVRVGNERVLKARLEDAAFFWQEDLKAPLEAREKELKKVIFQESLGTMYQKVERISRLAQHIVSQMGGDDDTVAVTRKAARLAKADLVTNMVYEFPELQGVMGREYALRSGESSAVAKAIFEHYLPRHAGDELPVSLPGKALSLADKIDTLVGCFAVGIQPTGSQDPYALRRQALGICRIALDYGPGLSLRDMVGRAYTSLNEMVNLEYGREEVWTALQDFFRQRLRGLLAEKGLKYDTIESVLVAELDDIADIFLRGKAVEEFRHGTAFAALHTAFTRAYNLSKKSTGGTVDVSLLEEGAEKNLYEKFEQLQEEVKPLIAARDYSGALEHMARLQKYVDVFFDQVMVMVEDRQVRENRLALLKSIADFTGMVADFSKLVQERGNGNS